MENFWLLFGLLGWALAILLAFVLMHVSGNQDRIARHMEMKIRIAGNSPVPRNDARPRSDVGGSASVDKPNPG